MRCYLVVNLNKQNAPVCAADAAHELSVLGCQVLVSPEVKRLPGLLGCVAMDEGEAMQSCDIVLSIGGDGTMIHTAIAALAYNKPIIGINSGRLGYLTQIDYPFCYSIKKLLKGHYTIQKRTVLEAELLDAAGKRSVYYAVNDIVIARNSVGNMVDMEIERDSAPFASYRADGLIFATPTGSTAYSMSAGGAIVDPNMDCLIMTPICPHSLGDRSVVLDGQSPLQLQLVAKNSFPQAGVAVDGELVADMDEHSRLVVRSAEQKVSFIQLNDISFYKTLGKKLLGIQ